MERAAGQLDGFAILAIEASWRAGELHFKETKLGQFESLGGKSVVIRLGQSVAAMPWTPEGIQMVGEWVGKLAKLGPREIHLDYDCPARKLDEYRKLMTEWRKPAGRVPLVFTALPSWLGERSFKELARQNPGYVLQVHSLDLPSRPDEPVILCDPKAAKSAVSKASGIGVPFRVALPTYGSEVLFGSDGKVLDVVSEDASPVPAARVANRRCVMADPAALGALVADWKSHRPRHLQGIIWYRLPIEGDRRNWPWTTLSAVITCQPIHGECRLHGRPSSGNATDLVLANTGNAPAPLPASLPLPAGTMAADGARPYRLETSGTCLVIDPEVRHWPWLAPGQILVVGWINHPEPFKHLPEFHSPSP